MAIKRVVLIFAMLLCTNSYADIYKCTDAKGEITYSSSECTNNGGQSINLSAKISKTTKTSRTARFEGSELKNEIPAPSDAGMQKNTASLKAELPKKIPSSSNQPQNYHCDGRIYCSQMTSCAEATFFLKNCPGTKMDGGRAGEQPDGIPCESQWCN